MPIVSNARAIVGRTIRTSTKDEMATIRRADRAQELPEPTWVTGQGELSPPVEDEQALRSRAASLRRRVGNALFGGFFVYNGINHFVHYRDQAAYARSKGVAAPWIAVPFTGLLLLAGGLYLATGRRPALGASLVTTFLLGVSPRMHAFWNETDPERRTNELINFTKNMALVGGALVASTQPALGDRHTHA